MQKDTLLALLQKPENLLEDHLEELEELVQKYPYFHLPHTLIAKFLHSRQSSLASQKIRKASLYVYSRAILKEFILNNSNLDVKKEFESQEKQQRNPFADIQQEIDDFDKKMETSTIEDLEKELANITESYLPKDYLAEETKLQESKNTSEEAIEQTENQKEQNLLIDDFLNNLNKTSEINDNLHLPENPTEEDALRLFDEGNTQAAIAIYEQLKLKFPEKASYYQSQIDIFSMDFSNLNLSDTEITENVAPNLLQENTSENFNTGSLIDDFLASSTKSSIEKNELQEEKSENTPEASSINPNTDNTHTEHTEITSIYGEEVSESQAIECFNNGDIQKAIEIYRQLILQNPDKKAYFTSQIEILES
ncbi:MAG: tetratricopeptide repeat protein [Raineya sp.]